MFLTGSRRVGWVDRLDGFGPVAALFGCRLVPVSDDLHAYNLVTHHGEGRESESCVLSGDYRYGSEVVHKSARSKIDCLGERKDKKMGDRGFEPLTSCV